MAYRRKTRRYSSAPPKRRRKTYKTKAKRRATPRSQRVTVVLQMQPATGGMMMPAGLTLGKKNYRPVRARY